MIFDNLNKEQQEAVRATEGRVRVIAGAGSGKTRVLAYRYAYLVNELGIDPANILCLTFTNKAAQEMQARIAKLVSAGHVNDFVCTIHGFCVKFLREEIYRLGYPQTFQILDEEDNVALAKEVLAENGLSRKGTIVKQILAEFGVWKKEVREEYISDFLLTTSRCKDNEEEKKSLMVQLLLKQQKYMSLDFHDLIHFTRHILKNFKDVCENWQHRMSYIMVDEVQDCNELEWEIFSALADHYHNLFVVGDPDQSIYEWRGGKVDLFLSFKADKDIVLDRNYRSTSTILDAANAIIANNNLRIEKNLYTLSNPGTIITHFHGKNEQEESEWISSKILELKDAGGKFADNAVLIRASYLSRSIEQSFLRRGINYVVWGGIRFFERKEIKDALSYLRLIAFDDDISFMRIANVPSRKIGKKAMETINGIAKAHNCSLFSALQLFNDSQTNKKESFVHFLALINAYREIQRSLSVSDLLNGVLRDSGLLDLYRDDTEEERLENLTELLNSVKLYEEDNKEDDVTLTSYLQDVALYTNADYTKDKNQVKIMTIHQAKGLEFPNVFVAGLSEGIFPNRRSVRDRKERGMEEERRLMYVAVTRAQDNLFLTESEGFLSQGGFNKYPSRFIREIKPDLYVTQGEISEEIWKNAESFMRSIDRLMCENTEETLIEVGSVVVHEHFGEGVVKEIYDEGQYCKVEFPQIGLRPVKTEKLSLKNAEGLSEEEFDEDYWDEELDEPTDSAQEELLEQWNEAIEDYRRQGRMYSVLEKAVVDVGGGLNRVIIPVQNEAQRKWLQERILPKIEKKVLSDDGIQEIVIEVN